MIFLHSIIVITDEKDNTRPIEIICLEGLEVTKSYDKTFGFGIDIAHRDGIF